MISRRARRNTPLQPRAAHGSPASPAHAARMTQQLCVEGGRAAARGGSSKPSHSGFYSPLSLTALSPSSAPLTAGQGARSPAENSGQSGFQNARKDESAGGDVEAAVGGLRLWGGFDVGRVEQHERGIEARANTDCVPVAVYDDLAEASITAAEVHDAARDGTCAWEQVVSRLVARLQGSSTGISVIHRHNEMRGISKEGNHVALDVPATTAAVSAAVVESCR